jgi:SagB-type dehydrogenase family enzyme
MKQIKFYVAMFLLFAPLTYSYGATANDSLTFALRERATNREFVGGHISRAALDMLVWAADGNSHSGHGAPLRTAPSAMATYPIDMYYVIESVDSLADGIYRYDNAADSLVAVKDGKFLAKLQELGWGQGFVSKSNLVALMVYDRSRIEPKCKEGSDMYAYFECGHIGQNLLLMATSLGLGSVPKASFDPKAVGELLSIPSGQSVVYMICVGKID